MRQQVASSLLPSITGFASPSSAKKTHAALELAPGRLGIVCCGVHSTDSSRFIEPAFTEIRGAMSAKISNKQSSSFKSGNLRLWHPAVFPGTVLQFCDVVAKTSEVKLQSVYCRDGHKLSKYP